MSTVEEILSILSAPVWAAIAIVQYEHPEYATPDGAYDRCCDASEQLLMLLPSSVDAAPINVWSRDGITLCAGHTGVEVEGMVVDLTARQFDPTAEWPMVVPADEWAEWYGQVIEAGRGVSLQRDGEPL